MQKKVKSEDVIVTIAEKFKFATFFLGRCKLCKEKVMHNTMCFCVFVCRKLCA